MSEFVLCINNNKGNPASLIVGKVCQAPPDSEAEGRNLLRMLDEDTSR